MRSRTKIILFFNEELWEVMGPVALGLFVFTMPCCCLRANATTALRKSGTEEAYGRREQLMEDVSNGTVDFIQIHLNQSLSPTKESCHAALNAISSTVCSTSTQT